MSESRHTVFGIRHHGPGSARSLRAALDALAPDAVLIEGPPDADELIPFVDGPSLKPPVAILIYPPDAAQRGVFYPFAEFSPEWQALRHAHEKGVPARFMDLPQSMQLALPREARGGDRVDPIGELARAAGYEDAELWWEQKIEQRVDGEGLFAAVLEAMTALRAELGEGAREDLLREAQMRKIIRAAYKVGYQRIAVVCGAWHAPALAGLGPAKADDALLKGLTKLKVQSTWIPWTHSRLASRSGYGAGVTSPGWYAHLWKSPDRAAIRWVAQSARLLREEDLDAAPASVIETVRLAEALAALRNRPMPGLEELREATLAVLCRGHDAELELIHERIEVGEALGEVPPEVPAVPLQKDLETLQRSYRLKQSTEIKEIDLDLRKELDREKSRFLHRLGILELGWAEPLEALGKAGTFHEPWRLQWEPEMALRIVEASVFGQTVESAASAAAQQRADKAADLPTLASLLDAAILASLPEAVEHVLARVQQQAALHADVIALMSALVPLSRAARYGDVRGTPGERLVPVLEGLFERVLIGLPAACASLDDEAAAALLAALEQVEEALRVLGRADLRAAWLATIAELGVRDGVHGLLRGRFARLRVDAQALGEEGLRDLASRSLSRAVPPAEAAAFIDGLLRGGALSLLHQEGLWRALDGWLRELPPDSFIDALPLARRAFANFPPPERRAMGEKMRALQGGASPVAEREKLHPERAARVLPVLAQIIGGQQ